MNVDHITCRRTFVVGLDALAAVAVIFVLAQLARMLPGPFFLRFPLLPSGLRLLLPFFPGPALHLRREVVHVVQPDLHRVLVVSHLIREPTDEHFMHKLRKYPGLFPENYTKVENSVKIMKKSCKKSRRLK